jgi:hypothetical protein
MIPHVEVVRGGPILIKGANKLEQGQGQDI